MESITDEKVRMIEKLYKPSCKKLSDTTSADVFYWSQNHVALRT